MLIIDPPLEVAGAGSDPSLITGFELRVNLDTPAAVGIEDLAILASPATASTDGFGTLELTRARIANGLSDGLSRSFLTGVEFHESLIENNAGSGIISDDGS